MGEAGGREGEVDGSEGWLVGEEEGGGWRGCTGSRGRRGLGFGLPL